MTATLPPNVIKVDFGSSARARAALTGDDTDALPVGQLVSYWDRANPLKQSVVTSEPDRTGFQRYMSEDGGESTLSGFGLAEKPESHAGWQLVRNGDGTPRVLSPDDIASFVATARAAKAAEEIERVRVAEDKVRERAAATADLLTNFAYLENAATAKVLGCVLAARNIRTRLRREFPGSKFSVTTSRFSGGTSVRIYWENGPTTAAVDALVDCFQTCDFDGSDDSSHFRHDVWTELFGGARFVQTSRKISAANYLSVAAELGMPGVTATESDGISTADYQDRETLLRVASERAFA